ncbi:dynamin family protein [Rubrivivax rivuli]|uniref:Dynamin family protein n=1 Tax=Rubrivivax rivuli TaxID=1862385 RepID=A0A437RKN5_9BURK|nr:dynamin family protein [Rubrivivax rivuli]RVU47318.1 dynamin family protein [Rubrivivax rivuli]
MSTPRTDLPAEPAAPAGTPASAIAQSLDALAGWRAQLERHIVQLGRALADQDLLDDGDGAVLAGLRDRLASDKLVLAFVAEFSRGKSELINAIFFADAGRRVLPATPGRTTMCPVELRHEPQLPPRLSLLPIETRLRGLSLTELRPRDEHWQHVPLDAGNAQTLVQALGAVTRTQRVSVEQAVALGFWSESQPEDNPPQAEDGSVEVPAWRHAVINYPHPLLQRGLVVIDTPGLNAVGAEPELTLGMLPSAHAIVFVLGADTGVTRSDLAIWREHLGQSSLDRFVVLNKIDTLEDPLGTPEGVQAQIEQQRLTAAETLGVAPARVFALSAREALAARVGGDAAALQASRLPPLEQALADELLPRRQALLVQSAVSVVQQLRASASRRVGDRRRQHAEQLMELRGLRGKSGAKLRMMMERVELEVADFERCTSRLVALRSVQGRILRTVLAGLSAEALRNEVATLQAAMGARPLNLGARGAFDDFIGRLRQALAQSRQQADELRQMLEASFRQLNTEFGFAFSLGPVPDMKHFEGEIELIAENYGRYLGITQAWRLAAPGFAEQFRRMLSSKLRVVFENAAAELELWSKGASGQVESQLGERRRGFMRRREALQRVQAAAGDLEQRIAEVQAQEDHLGTLQARLDALAAEAIASAQRLGREVVPGLAARDAA